MAIATNDLFIVQVNADSSLKSISFGALETSLADTGGYLTATSGSGAPSTTPSLIGQVYVDTLNDQTYIAGGTASAADWIISQSGTSVTNLSYTAAPTNGVVVSSTGIDATLTAATTTNAGLMLPAQFDKLALVTVTGAIDLDDAVLVSDTRDIATTGTITGSSFSGAAEHNSKTSGTLVAADANTTINATGTITVPNNVFSAGDIILVYNTTTSNLQITAGISLMHLDGTTASDGNRTVASYGLALIYFRSATECVVAGGAVT